MSNIAVPLVNGTYYDHNSLDVNIYGTSQFSVFITKIDYKDSLEPGEARGAYPAPLGFTIGSYKSDASFSILRAQYYNLQAYVMNRSGGSIGLYQVTFDILVNYISDIPGNPIITDTLKGCRIKAPSSTSAQGGTPNEMSIDLNTTYVLLNNVRPLTNMKL